MGSRWSKPILLVGGCIALLALIVGGGEMRTTKCRQYVSYAMGYTVCIPPGWQPLEWTDDPGSLVNFDPNLRETGNIRPPGGAMIELIRPTSAMDIRDAQSWADSENLPELSRRSLALCCNRGNPRSVLESKRGAGGIEPVEMSLNDYFSVSGELFRATLLYWKGDPNLKAYAAALHDVVLSLELKPRQPLRSKQLLP